MDEIDWSSSAPLLGFVGVVVGGLIAIVAQIIDRWAKREYERRRDAANLVASCLLYETSLYQWHAPKDHEFPKDVQDAIMANLTKTQEEVNRFAAVSIITGGLLVRSTAQKLQNRSVEAGNYLSPTSQQGVSENYSRKDDYFQRLKFEREALLVSARSMYFLRGVTAIKLSVERKNLPKNPRNESPQ